MAKKQKQEVVEKEEAGLPAEMSGTWGGEGLDSGDIIVPRILLMQPMSELVTGGDAKIGEFRDSMDKSRVLGNEKTPLEVIIFGSFKTWVEFIDGEFDKIYNCTRENADLPLEQTTETGLVTRDRVINYQCLLPGDVEKGEAFPYVLSCRRTSYKAGKQIATIVKKLAMFKKPSAAKVIQVMSVKTKNDKGTFFVLEACSGRDATAKEMKAAWEWHQVLARSQFKVHDDVEDDNPVDAPEVASDAASVQATGI